MENLKRVQIADGVYFNTIFDERFKTSRIAVTMLVELKRDTVAANAVVPNILTRCCEEYPTFLQLSRELNMMYGASLSGRSGKLGEVQPITISVAGIDDKYSLDGESVYKHMAELLCSVLFRPKLVNGCFDEEDFKQEQRQMLDTIDAEFNDKRVYAFNRMLEIMCGEELYSINKYGTKEQVSALTAEDVFKAYKNILKTARVEIMCLGSSDTAEVCELFKKHFSAVERRLGTYKTEVIEKADKVKEHTDKLDVTQSKLIIGFRTAVAQPMEEVEQTTLMSVVLGGTAHSKLFLNVREKLSLCYYCASRFDSYKGIMYIESGVEKQNIEKAKKAILEQVEDMKNGNITDEEISSAKLSVSNSYLTSVDSSAGTQSWYIGQILKGTQRTPQEEADIISAVTKEQIVTAANKLTLDTIYVLTGNDENADEEV